MDQEHSAQDRWGEQESHEEILDFEIWILDPREGQENAHEVTLNEEEVKCDFEDPSLAVLTAT